MFGFDAHKTRSGQPRTRRSRLIISYIPDYLFSCLMSKIEPFERDFTLTNKTIQYPHKPDSVPFYAANLAGRHRPDFISRCNLDTTNAQTLEPFIGLLTTKVCRPEDHKVFLDGMRSFPSGHTSFSFAGLTYLSLWLAGHMHIGDRRGRAYKSFIVLAPELDYRHHWQDVLAGAILGLFMGWFGYREYYPSPLSDTQDPCAPYPPRIPENECDHEGGPEYGMKQFTNVASSNPTVSAAAAIAAQAPGRRGLRDLFTRIKQQPNAPGQVHINPNGIPSRDSLTSFLLFFKHFY
ncbi:phosphatidic acid phosphatase type 2/haloperoxidase [Kickxella alabastrina]|uniref:phosphatidic acid phosphatase type 2/haloperoxidase n=1 Tax=Kickxella alabastrina TaxID=61397 RepID=UPI002220992D|nr:phosphatidic acid phosphatase type 2/haloperoxidase [Kickxella alabastrina]KAI7833807.1 phosphatidic acid phosphatase type 2/haloperoxidase [Kickxella alabastrina]